MIPTETKRLPDLFDYQDTHQERVIHCGWDKGNNYRYVLEGAGDIFRELTKPTPHDSYLYEKINRIEGHIEEEKKGLQDEDTFQYSLDNNKDKFELMAQHWKSQPYITARQNDAIKLNISLLNGDFDSALASLTRIKMPKHLNTASCKGDTR